MKEEDKGSISIQTQHRYATSLTSFLPESVKRYISKIVEGNDELKVPQSQSFETVALFADVSGFTALTDLLAKKGPLGAEEIGFYLNRYLEQLMKIIARSGGDVFKFAGDAIVVLWPSDEESSATDLADMVHRAASCSLNIQSELHNAALEQHVTMSLKLGVGVGRVTILHVGGVHGRIEFLAAGTPLMQAFRAEHMASAGDAIMSIEAWRMVETKFSGEQIDEFNVRLKGCKHPIRNVSVRRTMLHWNKKSLDLLRAYVPAAVLPYLKINQKLWSAELRQVSVLFINLGLKLDDFDNAAGINGPLDLVQKVVAAIQEATYLYEGSLNKFLVDDKGSTLLVVFGLPPLAHENDPTRAVLASLTILSAMNQMQLKCKIGVTSGLALCGLVGSGSRREYSVLGDLVNLSARLMQSSDGNVLCDKATFLATRNQRRLQFSTPAPIHVKGKTDIVIVHQPEMAIRVERFQAVPKCKITVGFKSEIAQISTRIDNFISVSEDGFVSCVTGEIGAGKTHLLRHLSFYYNEKLTIIWGRGDAFSSMKSIQIFQSLFSCLSSAVLPHLKLSAHEFSKVLEEANRSDLIPIIELLNPYDGDGVRRSSSQPPLPRSLSYFDEEAIARKIFELLTFIIDIVTASKRRMLLIFDECHWVGQESWKVIGSLCQMVENKTLKCVSIIVGTRPLDHDKYRPLWGGIPSEYVELKNNSSSLTLVLENLGISETKELIQAKTKGLEPDQHLVSLIFERTAGRPLFCNKFMDALLTVNALVMEKSCQLSAEWRTRSEWDTELPIPYRIQRITACQLDRLTPSQMMLLKIAAVITIAQGEGALRFNLGMVRQANPIHEYISSISSDIQALIKFGVVFEEHIVQEDRTSPVPMQRNTSGNMSGEGNSELNGDEFRNEVIPIDFDEEMKHEPIPYTKIDASADAKTYRFSYGFVRDFLYQIMLYKQRQKLHRICSDYIQAHLQESANKEQEQMVLSRHIFLSGATYTEGFLGMAEVGRKSTVIPSRLSGSSMPESFSQPDKWANNEILKASDQNQTVPQDVPVIKVKQHLFRKIFCCFSERNKKEPIQSKKIETPSVTRVVNEAGTDPNTVGTSIDEDQPSLKVSLSAFGEMQPIKFDASERRTTVRITSPVEVMQSSDIHQRKSPVYLGSSQESLSWSHSMSLDKQEKSQSSPNVNMSMERTTIMNLVPVQEFDDLSKPDGQFSQDIVEDEQSMPVRFSLTLDTLPNTPRTMDPFQQS